MLPLLYNYNTLPSSFNNNGLGFIRNCTKCKAIEERNGLYELELEALTNDQLAESLVPKMFVKAKANPHDAPQIFEIYSTSVTDTKISAKAQHLKYIAGANLIKQPFTEQAMTPTDTWNYIQSHDYYRAWESEFAFYSDITSVLHVTAGDDKPTRLGDFIQGVRGSMVDVYGGELHFDNFRIELLQSRGTNTGIAIRYGSNISSFSQDSNINTVYTHLMPYATVNAKYYENGGTASPRKIYGELIDLHNTSLTYRRCLEYDFTDEMQGKDDILVVYASNETPVNWDNITGRLQTKAQNYIDKNSTALTEPSVNIKVDIADTLKKLENCKLCDTVQVYFEPLGFSANAKIVRTEYDSLLEKYTKIELGTMKKTIADLFSGKNIGGA